MGGSLGLVVLDETFVGVALPTIRDDLATSQVTAHWIISAYLVVFTGHRAQGLANPAIRIEAVDALVRHKETGKLKRFIPTA